MIESFYNARTGAIANNYGINVLSNNISNINTVGYKIITQVLLKEIEKIL